MKEGSVAKMDRWYKNETYFWILFKKENDDTEPELTIGRRSPAIPGKTAAYWQIIGADELISVFDKRIIQWMNEIKMPKWIEKEE